MRLLHLKRRRRRRRGQIRARNRLIASRAKGSISQQHDDSHQGDKSTRYSGPDLPEDIWHYIHSLVPLRDAARAACVSHAFLHSWRCRPKITLRKTTFVLNENVFGENQKARDFNIKVDNILKKHSPSGLKTLEIELCGYDANSCYYLNSWLETAFTPDLEELTLLLPGNKAKYSFPSSLLCNGGGNSIRYLHLSGCGFDTTVGLDCLKKLTSVHLHDVCVTGDELGYLFSNSTGLEHFGLSYCDKITYLKIPWLQRLSCFSVVQCNKLQVIESKAPNISSIHLSGIRQVELSLGESLQMKDLTLSTCRSISYACSKLPSFVPNLEILSLGSSYEVVNTPVVQRTFLHLKHLNMSLHGMTFCPAYDCFSVVYFLDAAPSLEAFSLGVSQLKRQQKVVVGDPSPLRQIAVNRHNNLKRVKITGFCSAKWLVELTCYILENAIALDCLTLDTTSGSFRRCSAQKLGSKCFPVLKSMVRTSEKAQLVVRSYIEGKVPPSVKFNVLRYCSLCHAY